MTFSANFTRYSSADRPHSPGAQKVSFSIASTKGLKYIMCRTDRQKSQKGNSQVPQHVPIMI